ncbi:hypothetical protein AB1N83_011988 [Pleurotus pulmonarius]
MDSQRSHHGALPHHRLLASGQDYGAGSSNECYAEEALPISYPHSSLAALSPKYNDSDSGSRIFYIFL